MDKNSTPLSSRSSISTKQSATPSVASLSRIRQFARTYVCFQQTSHLGGIILN
ncbi:MAG: hypothetical protein K2J94_01050 [Duncaniella sp.]|nr:hypothetical protein [Duncaniella sp.]